ncbi:MAG: zf-HC2 domain-containing protein [Candidatus Omnitrophota bacterium]|nr:zf-HC2 domain-containing protein [Candidatus Omnitrophota bacterium]
MGINIMCLDEKTLSSYLDERLSDAERKKIEGHIADCNVCLDMLLVAYEARRKKFSAWPLSDGLARTILAAAVFFKPKNRTSQAGSAEKIKKKRSGLKWLFAGLFFFVLSFIFRHYFLQFLAISVVLGFKWVMEGEGAKRVMMIFKGIPEKEKNFERKSPRDVSNVAGGDRYGEPE